MNENCRIKPELKLDYLNSVELQLKCIRKDLIEGYQTKPVEGLDKNYVDTQRVLMFVASFIYAIEEIVKDVNKDVKLSIDDILMRMSKVLKMLSDPYKTYGVCGKNEIVEFIIESNKMEYRNYNAIGYEWPYKKSCIWGLASLMRVFAAGKILNVNCNMVNLDDENNNFMNSYLEYAIDVFSMDFKCISFNYGKYSENINNGIRFGNMNRMQLYERNIKLNKVLFIEEEVGPIDRYFIQNNNITRKPECYAEIIKSMSVTQDALCGFACDIKINDGLDDEDGLDIISTNDNMKIVDENSSEEEKKMCLRRNAKQALLRRMMFTNKYKPCNFRCRKGAPKPSNYQRSNIFYSIPRMLRGCNLFHGDPYNTYNQGDYLSVFNIKKSLYGDVLDSLVGLQCLLKRSRDIIKGVGDKNAFINYINNYMSQGDIIIAMTKKDGEFGMRQPTYNTDDRMNNNEALNSLLGSFLYCCGLEFAYIDEDRKYMVYNPDTVVFFIAMQVVDIDGVYGIATSDFFNDILIKILDMLFSSQGIDTPPDVVNASSCYIPLNYCFQFINTKKNMPIKYTESNDDNLRVIPYLPPGINSQNNFIHIQKNFICNISKLIQYTSSII